VEGYLGWVKQDAGEEGGQASEKTIYENHMPTTYLIRSRRYHNLHCHHSSPLSFITTSAPATTIAIPLSYSLATSAKENCSLLKKSQGIKVVESTVSNLFRILPNFAALDLGHLHETEMYRDSKRSRKKITWRVPYTVCLDSYSTGSFLPATSL